MKKNFYSHTEKHNFYSNVYSNLHPHHNPETRIYTKYNNSS